MDLSQSETSTKFVLLPFNASMLKTPVIYQLVKSIYLPVLIVELHPCMNSWIQIRFFVVKEQRQSSF